MNFKYFNRHELLFFIPKDYTKVLEIGCGTVEFFKNLKKMYNAVALILQKKLHYILLK